MLRSLRRLPMALAIALGANGAAHAGTDTPWVGTWAVAAKPIGETDFAGQTLRQIMHTSIAGHAARIRLSNANGDVPLTLTSVHIAQSAGGSSTKPETDRPVTFGGRTTITLAPGEEIVSDRVTVAVPSLADMVVSFYVPQATHAVTGHDFSSQTRYQAQGDVAGQAQIQAWADANYAFVTNIDVQGEDPQGAVVALGASITDGYDSTFNANRRWPNALAARLAAAGKNVGVLNEGISGNRLLQDGAGLSATHRFDHDALDQTGVRWIIVSDDPINDLGDRPVPSAASLIDAEKALIARAHARGIRVLCSTLTPFEGSDHWSAEGEAARGEINAFLRGANSGCDGVIDQDLATHDPKRPTWFLPAYDAGDHLHPNDAGYQAIANAVDLGFFTRPTVPAVAPTQGCGSIGPGEGLLPGQAVVSCDGGYRLDLQDDSNAVLYKAGAPLWNTATVDRDASGLRLEADGNLVLYSAFGTTLWQSHSGGHDAARLFVQGDGNMVIYDNAGPVWSTGTSGR